MEAKLFACNTLAVVLLGTALAACAAPTVAPTPPKQRESPPQFLTVAVPDVKGKTFAEADAILKKAGFVAVNDGKVGIANKLNVDRVASQDPVANARAAKGSKVKLKIYFYQVLRY